MGYGDDMEQKKANASTVKAKTAAPGAKNAVTARKMSSHPTVRRSASEFTHLKIVTQKKDGEKKPFPWTTVFTAICFTVLFLFMMMNYIALDDLNEEVAEQNQTINALTDEKEKLEDKLAKKDNLDEITKYAENNLGMVKKDEVKGEYHIDINTDDEIKITEYKDERENGLGVLLTGAGNVIKEFFGG